ncbi:MAG: undecaprenyl-phosphate glucose phosphotransferase [Lachnospiraceae bacterium]|jgi:Undecaprenyl-phosphate glucose phosphotransferase|nr:undecaprenyl-phosphate glucose phosphotransferase [uncultured Acetatifactor sp.]MCI8696017.1 undecaprenyl-phosphate glucose phosphotransferase [Lachnospiraceae bacterium]MCI9229559.1 undecaprenyl-phosphate glucose phosphotransferase [Lachnospiraceae bacterium]MCI9571054.1 undecaprenyl-phosphate glucose phosphotransferase [Lachnospiraceae bacterium]
MIKDNQKVFNRLMVIIDVGITAASFMLAYGFKFYFLGDGPGLGVLPLEEYIKLLPVVLPVYALIYYICGVYAPKRTVRRRFEIFGIIKANNIGIVALIIVLYMIIREINFSRSVIGFFYIINVLVTSSFRLALRRGLRTIRRKGYNLKHILLVGYSRAAEEYIDRLSDNPQWGYVACGILDNHIPAGTMYKGVKVLGRLGNLEVILPENKLDEIAISLSLKDYDHLESIVAICEKFGVHTKFIPDYNSLIPSKPYTEDLMGLPVINIRYVPLTNTGNIIMKRIVDVVGSLMGIVITSPIMLLSALLIKLTSPGPVIFKQERVGLHNKPFHMYKLRTMERQAPGEEKKAWTVRNDPRVTPVGKFLRRTSLDELPQLFNILRGDMSLVGPRPERPLFVDKFKEEIPRYMVKHQVRPGLTGWAQVNGLRGNTSIRKRIEYDIYYIENWTMWFDMKIIFMTFFTGFINKNAY